MVKLEANNAVSGQVSSREAKTLVQCTWRKWKNKTTVKIGKIQTKGKDCFFHVEPEVGTRDYSFR